MQFKRTYEDDLIFVKETNEYLGRLRAFHNKTIVDSVIESLGFSKRAGYKYIFSPDNFEKLKHLACSKIIICGYDKFSVAIFRRDILLNKSNIRTIEVNSKDKMSCLEEKFH
jgi:hypothetical protein